MHILTKIYDLPFEILILIFKFSNSQKWKRVCKSFFNVFKKDTNLANYIYISCIKKCKIENVPINKLKNICDDDELLTSIILNSVNATKYIISEQNISSKMDWSHYVIEEYYKNLSEDVKIIFDEDTTSNQSYIEYISVKSQKTYESLILSEKNIFEEFLSQIIKKGQSIILKKIIAIIARITTSNSMKMLIKNITQIATECNNYDIYEIMIRDHSAYVYKNHLKMFIKHGNKNAVTFTAINHYELTLPIEIVIYSIIYKQNDIFKKYRSFVSLKKLLTLVNLSIEYNNEYVFCDILDCKYAFYYAKNQLCYFYRNDKLIRSTQLYGIYESCKVNNNFRIMLANIIKKHENKYYKNSEASKFIVNDVFKNLLNDNIVMNNSTLKCPNKNLHNKSILKCHNKNLYNKSKNNNKCYKKYKYR